MHTFLVYLRMAPMKHKPTLATHLLQLDLLAEPRKMSIYREEAVEALIEALHRKEFSNSQMMALDALGSLSARRTSSGDPYMETWLLKIAGFDQPYNALMKAEKLTKNENDLAETNLAESMEDEERAESSWEKRVAFVLSNHEKGSIFKALQECFKSNSLESAKSCLVISTWLIYMLSVLPDTGVKSAAPALEALGKYAKCIYRTLRKLKRSSPVVTDVLKSLMKMSSVNATELWNCTEVVEVESFVNGKLLSLLHLEGRVISSHSDGTIKAWDAGKRVLRRQIVQWFLGQNNSGTSIMKEAVYELAANDKVACFVSQGPGVKVYSWSDVPKHINFNRTVKCLAMTGDTLYCGASGYSIQEVDLSKFTSTTFYSGTRKMLGKQSIYSLNIQDGLLFAGGSTVDGTVGKVRNYNCSDFLQHMLWKITYLGEQLPHMAVNGDFIFTATRSGTIEVWLRERFARVASIKVGGGGHTRVTCLASDMNGGMLYAGTSDGRIQAWALD
ncbi:putative E3 ubiquitin-protein ligase LIN-1 [Populus alba]|uniref:putative E3 ubiquitin-protein ligase LIN-1 n=1 Tax=Populus alba TaxID=43335 RepID=UPI003CC6F8D0